MRGDARARGRAHGEALRERIRATFDFYMTDLFAASPLSPEQIRTRAGRVETIVEAVAPSAATEIRAIAEGAELEAWQIFILNARTEILNARLTECTALYFENARVLAQNWDWVKPLEALCVVMTHVKAEGRSHVTFVEPGMIGKIGLNSDGLGVCLNILFAPHGLEGLPIHVLNGALLDCRDLAEARALMARAGLGKASHVLVGDDRGGCVAMEYFGDERLEIAPADGVLLHTNHCVAKGAAGRTADVATSCGRYDRTRERVAEEPVLDLEGARHILLDGHGGAHAINRPYRPQTLLGSHDVGTCATLLMDLPARTLEVKKGPGATGSFTRYILHA